MINKNYKNMLSMILHAASVNHGALPLRDVNGKVCYSSHAFSCFPYAYTQAATLSKTSEGISVGTGSTAPTEDDYNLAEPLTAGISLTVTSVSTGCEAPGNPYHEYHVTVVNNGSEAITVREICDKQKVKAAQKPGSASASDTVVMLDRSLLDPALTVQPGDAGIIHYRLVTATPQRSVNGVAIASWTWGSDEQIAAMLDAAQAGTIDLQTDGGWRVGEMRTIAIGAFTGSGNRAHAAQNVNIAISSFDDYNNCGCVMQFDFAETLALGQQINSTPTNAGGYDSTPMYTETLPALVEALPGWLKSRLKTFSVLAGEGSRSSSIETIGGSKLALRAEVEIFGTNVHSPPGEGAQLDYYKITGNRMKTKSNSTTVTSWWLRSPSTQGGASFAYVNSSGALGSSAATNGEGLAPFGCV